MLAFRVLPAIILALATLTPLPASAQSEPSANSAAAKSAILQLLLSDDDEPGGPGPGPGPTDPVSRLFGINLAGAEFGQNIPGTFGTDYIYPNQREVDYYASRRMNLVRLPFGWERLQPRLNAAFDAAELQRLTAFVNATTAKGVSVILDPHNYARYFGKVIADIDPSTGSPYVSNADFADFWRRLSQRFASNPRVIFGLMNEPHGMPTAQWRRAANAAIAAIRGAGANNLILVPGNGYSGAHSWLNNWYDRTNPNSGARGPNGYLVGSNAEEMRNIVDPGNNFAFDMHQYLDSDFSGTSTFCQDTTIGSRSLAQATDWLERHQASALLGEFGGGENQTCVAALDDITKYILDRPEQWIGWSYWAGGPWWPVNHELIIEPVDLDSANPTDRPQMASLMKNIPRTGVGQLQSSLDLRR